MTKEFTGQKKRGARTWAGQLGTPYFLILLISIALLAGISSAPSNAPNTQHTSAASAAFEGSPSNVVVPLVSVQPTSGPQASMDVWE